MATFTEKEAQKTTLSRFELDDAGFVILGVTDENGFQYDWTDYELTMDSPQEDVMAAVIIQLTKATNKQPKPKPIDEDQAPVPPHEFIGKKAWVKKGLLRSILDFING